MVCLRQHLPGPCAHHVHGRRTVAGRLRKSGEPNLRAQTCTAGPWGWMLLYDDAVRWQRPSLLPVAGLLVGRFYRLPGLKPPRCMNLDTNVPHIMLYLCFVVPPLLQPPGRAPQASAWGAPRRHASSVCLHAAAACLLSGTALTVSLHMRDSLSHVQKACNILYSGAHVPSLAERPPSAIASFLGLGSIASWNGATTPSTRPRAGSSAPSFRGVCTPAASTGAHLRSRCPL